MAMLGRALLATSPNTITEPPARTGTPAVPMLLSASSRAKNELLSAFCSLVPPESVGHLQFRRGRHNSPSDITGILRCNNGNVETPLHVIIGRDVPADLPADRLRELILRHPGVAAIVLEGSSLIRGAIPFEFRGSSGDMPCNNRNWAMGAAIRMLRAYHERSGTIIAEGWDAVIPEAVHERTRSLLGAHHALSPQDQARSRLRAFLTMDTEDRGYDIAYRVGHVTWFPDFKTTYEKVIADKLTTLDPAVMQQLGFKVSEKHQQVCLACKQIARGGADRCCAAYSNDKRTRKRVVWNMVMTPVINDDETDLNQM